MSINFTSSVFVFLLILECVNNVFICLFVFMENKTKMSINILLLLFAVLVSSKSAVSLSQLCVGLVKDVSERGFVNDPLLDIGDFETRLSPGPPPCTSCLQHSSIHAHSPPSHHSQNTRVESHTREKTLTGRAVSMVSDCMTFLDLSDLFYFGALLHARPLPPVLPDSFHTSPYKGEVPKRG